MNTTPDNPAFEPWNDPVLEARIVAWVLGESSAFEIAELDRLLKETPELKIFKQRITAVHGLVGEAIKPISKPLRLSKDRRKKLLQQLGARPIQENTVALPILAKQRRNATWGLWLKSIAATLALLAIPAVFVIGPLMRPAYQEKASLGQVTDAFFETSGAYSYGVTPEPMSAPAPATPQLAASKRSRLSEVDAISARETVNDVLARTSGRTNQAIADLGETSPAQSTFAGSVATAQPASSAAPMPSKKPASERDLVAALAPTISELESMDGDEFEEDAFGGGYAVPSGATERSDLAQADAPSPSRNTQFRPLEENSNSVDARRGMESKKLAAKAKSESMNNESLFVPGMVDSKEEVKKPNKSRQATAFAVLGEGLDTSSFADDDLRSEARKKAGVSSGKRIVGQKVDGYTYDYAKDKNVIDREQVDLRFESRSSKIAGRKEQSTNIAGNLEALGIERTPASLFERNVAHKQDTAKLNGADTSILLTSIAAPTDTSEREAPDFTDNEISTAEEPFSTFSLHVSDVSFRLAQAALERGETPDPQSIRPEEFYNAFDYNDPAPRSDEEVTCRIEQSAHPVLQQRNLVRIATQVAATGRGAEQPLHLTVLLDTSGSMEREDRIESVDNAMQVLASLLGPNDRISLIGFARNARLLVDGLAGDKAGQLVETIRSTPSEGGTDLEQALGLGREIALKHKSDTAQNRIVLLSDGAANLGSENPTQLATIVTGLRQQGIAFDACGVGSKGIDDTILESLTRSGDGRYYVLDSPEDADAQFAQKLAGAFRPAAENVKVQVRFNPARVANYRLIGFEKHRLKKEDFRNDKVDAAELAAEESAVALYQVEVIPDGAGELGEVSIRFRKAGDKQAAMVERSWAIAFDEQTPAFDQATPALQLAGSAAMLAEKLAATPVGFMLDLNTLNPVMNTLRANYPQNDRVNELNTMFQQIKRLNPNQ